MKTRDIAWLVCGAAALQSCSYGEDEMVSAPHQFEATRTFPAESFDALPEYSLRETLRVSGDSVPSGYEIVAPMGIVVSRDGSIYILDAGAREVIVFDSTGELVRRFGGEGRGPGEFSTPAAITMAADTIFVLDRLLHAFSLRGDLYYSTVADTAVKQVTPNQFVHTPQGLIITTSTTPSRAPRNQEVHVDTIVVEMRPHGSRNFSPRFVLPGDTFFVRGKGTYFHRLSGPVPHMAVSRAGHILFADGADYHIDVMSLDGVVEERIVAELEQTPIQADQMEALIKKAEASSRAHRKDNPQADDHTKTWRQLPRAAFRPVLGRLLPGDGRLVLVERQDTGLLGDRPIHSTWDIVHLDEGPLGRLSMEEGFLPLWYDREHVYGIDRSEMMTPMVVRYSIEEQTPEMRR